MMLQPYRGADLPRAHGGPVGKAVLRASPEDFVVDEVLGIKPDGHGEHVFLRVRKTGLTTRDVAKRLARFAAIREVAVGYSGLKDKQSRSTQWFSLHLPGCSNFDPSELNSPDLEVLELTRHSRKLRRAQHRANSFRLVLRGLSCDQDELIDRLSEVKRIGVPNYFGEQRFGNAGDNVEQALQMFRGKRVRRGPLRGLLLSAARSFLFNEVLARRVREGRNWCERWPGDVLIRVANGKLFAVDGVDDSVIDTEFKLGCVDVGAVLWGKGGLLGSGRMRSLEQEVADTYTELAQGLEQAGMHQQRRAIRLLVDQFRWCRDGLDLVLEFLLPVGGYATSVVREIAATAVAGDR